MPAGILAITGAVRGNGVCGCGREGGVVMSAPFFSFTKSTDDRTLSAFLAEDGFSHMSYADRVSTLDKAFAEALLKRNDMLGVCAVQYWVQACKGMAEREKFSHEESGKWIIGNLTSKYMAVYDRVEHGCETMEKTRLAIFQEVVDLWRSERTVSSIAAFQFCAAAHCPVSKSVTVGEDGTGAMRNLQGLYVSEKYAETTLSMMRDKIGNGIYFGVTGITELIDRYAGVNYFPDSVITMLAIARSRLGGKQFAQMDSGYRNACTHFNPAQRSKAAHALHDELSTKISAFDEIVKEHLLSFMMGDESIMATDMPDSFQRCLYGDLSWEYLALDNVSVKVTVPTDMPHALRRDMVRRADIHASRFYANVMERAVTVAIWLYVPGRADSFARVRYDKYGENTEPVDVG